MTTTTTLLTVNEAADRLRVHPASIRHAILNRRLVAHKQGRDWVIDEADLQRYARLRRTWRYARPYRLSPPSRSDMTEPDARDVRPGGEGREEPQ